LETTEIQRQQTFSEIGCIRDSLLCWVRHSHYFILVGMLTQQSFRRSSDTMMHTILDRPMRSVVGTLWKRQIHRRCRFEGFRCQSTATTTSSDPLPPYLNHASETTHFGFQQVPVAKKEEHVRSVFENVADSYDVMNDLMSGGLHRAWKDYLLQLSQVEAIASTVRRRHLSAPPEPQLEQNPPEPFQILDVAGGTGDVAFRFVEAAGCLERAKSSGLDECIRITVCDINAEMLRVGEQRATQRYGRNVMDSSQALRFVEGNAQDLHPFPDNTFDMYTIAFGLRNVTDVDLALKEAYRVLKPGGRFLCLEFSQVPNIYLRAIYDSYSFHVIPKIGEIVAGDRDSYQYLVESIRKFPNQTELLQRIQHTGFQLSKYTDLTGGIVAIHEGWKGI
jgi:ubiquinone/menaquinone biosynthesis methyltransferase